MHPPSLFMPFHHLVTILFFLKLSSLPTSFSGSYYDRYENCAPVMYACGKIKFNLSYPLRVDGRHDYCGHPNYYLSCINNTTLIISINNKGYLVKDVDSLNKMLTVVDQSLISQSCPEPHENTTIDPSLFSYSDRVQIATLYVNCTASTGIPTLYDIGCSWGVAGPQHSYCRFDNITNFVDLLGKCSSTVLVPMSQTAAFRLLNGDLSFRDALKEGFSLKWTAGRGWCSDCISSGGRCGHHHSSPDGHICYCPNGPAFGSCLSRNRGMLLDASLSLSSNPLVYIFLRPNTKYIKSVGKKLCSKNQCQKLKRI